MSKVWPDAAPVDALAVLSGSASSESVTTLALSSLIVASLAASCSASVLLLAFRAASSWFAVVSCAVVWPSTAVSAATRRSASSLLAEVSGSFRAASKSSANLAGKPADASFCFSCAVSTLRPSSLWKSWMPRIASTAGMKFFKFIRYR